MDLHPLRLRDLAAPDPRPVQVKGRGGARWLGPGLVAACTTRRGDPQQTAPADDAAQPLAAAQAVTPAAAAGDGPAPAVVRPAAQPSLSAPCCAAHAASPGDVPVAQRAGLGDVPAAPGTTARTAGTQHAAAGLPAPVEDAASQRVLAGMPGWPFAETTMVVASLVGALLHGRRHPRNGGLAQRRRGAVVPRREPVLAAPTHAPSCPSPAPLVPVPLEKPVDRPAPSVTPPAFPGHQWALAPVDATAWTEWLNQPPVALSLDTVRPAGAAMGAVTAPSPPVQEGVPQQAAVLSADPLTHLRAVLRDAGGEGLVLRPGVASAAPILHADTLPLPLPVVDRLWKAMAEVPDSNLARWVWVQVLSLGGFQLDGMDAAHVRSEAIGLTCIDAGADDEIPTLADWEALRLRLHLSGLEAQGTAARLLHLSRLRTLHAGLTRRDAAPVRQAWLEVLLFWADQQQGPAALARLAEAEQVCRQLCEAGLSVEHTHPLLVEVLLRRARLERGGRRAATLQQATQLASEAYAQCPQPQVALAVAGVALARAGLAPADAAYTLIEQALEHAFIASTDATCLPAALQLRLAAQLAYESLPDVDVPAGTTETLCGQLQRVPCLPAEAWNHIVVLYARHGRFQQACLAAAEAAHRGAMSPALMQAWEQAAHAWAQDATTEAQRAAWQENARLRQHILSSL